MLQQMISHFLRTTHWLQLQTPEQIGQCILSMEVPGPLHQLQATVGDRSVGDLRITTLQTDYLLRLQI